MIERAYYLTVYDKLMTPLLVKQFIRDPSVRVEIVNGKYKLKFPDFSSRLNFIRILDSNSILYEVG